MSNNKAIVKVGDVEGAEPRLFVAKSRAESQLCGWRQILVEIKYGVNIYTNFTNTRWYREKYSDKELGVIGIYYRGAKNLE